MIKNKKFVVYTTATNAESLGYMTTLKASIESITKHNFVDDFYILDGHSIDNTNLLLNKEKINNNKISILTSPVWKKESWTWETLLEQYNFFYEFISNECSSINNDIIVLYQCSDQIWTDDYANELHSNLVNMIDNNFDYIISPFRKMINKNYVTSIYDYDPLFSVYCSLRFRPGHKYQVAGREDSLKSSFPTRKMMTKFKNSSISYDMTFFTRQNLKDKIVHHQCGIVEKEIDDYIKNGFLRKCLRTSPRKILIDSHPIEIREQIRHINSDLFGYDCFGHFKDL